MSKSLTSSPISSGTSTLMTFGHVIFYFSPLLLMCFMFGSAIMSGTPFVFLFYFLALFLALLFRHLIWMLFGSTPLSSCGNEVYLPFIFGNYKEFMSTFVFVFSIIYIFGPYFNWKQTRESSIFMFVFLIVYTMYDISVRAYVSRCMTMNRATAGAVLGNAFMGASLGAATQAIMVQLGLSKFMYYGNNTNRPTKKVFRCGKVKK